MFDIIRKQEYFETLSTGCADPQDTSLKGIQDGWIISKLKGTRGLKIIEMGGGNSRLLPMLSENQCWNVDKLQGNGQGPTSVEALDHVEVVQTFFGEFDPSLPVVDKSEAKRS